MKVTEKLLYDNMAWSINPYGKDESRNKVYSMAFEKSFFNSEATHNEKCIYNYGDKNI